MYSIEGSRRHLWLASAFVIAVVLSFSRHSLLLLAITLGIFFLFQIRKIWTSSRSRRAAVVFACVCALVAVGGSFSSGPEQERDVFSPQRWWYDPVANMTLMALDASSLAFCCIAAVARSFRYRTNEERYIENNQRQAVWISPVGSRSTLPMSWAVTLASFKDALGYCSYGIGMIGAAANKVRKNASNPHELALAHACIIAVAVFVASGFFSEEMIARDCIPVFWLLAGLTLSSATKPTPGIHVSSSS